MLIISIIGVSRYLNLAQKQQGKLLWSILQSSWVHYTRIYTPKVCINARERREDRVNKLGTSVTFFKIV